MSFANLGFCYFQAALVDEIDELETLLDQVEQGGPGTRITDFAGLACFLDAKDVFGSILAAIDAHGARPVRAILFDKRADQNWALGWHQDRTICVREEIETEGFGPFSKKQGLVHVEPPFEVIERMITLRIHLDPVPEENAPLLVAEGSHRLGKIPVSEIDAVTASLPTRPCLADRGDIWAYSTPILHASKRSAASGRRRVLQVDYSSDELPTSLQWLGIH